MDKYYDDGKKKINELFYLIAVYRIPQLMRLKLIQYTLINTSCIFSLLVFFVKFLVK